MSLLSPIVAALQACPPILWISLLLVWSGQGNSVPLGVVFASVFPPLFANIAQGAASLDQRLFDMAKVHMVGRIKVLRHIIWPGVYPYLIAGLSYALGACWKITAVAEFLGSSDGMGSRLYWSYRMLELTQLFSWALLLVTMGMFLEILVVRPLRGLQKG
jgi:NitT/TauT family transport system permease protein